MSNIIITITDFMDPNLDVYARLTENQLLNRANPKEGMFIAESPKRIFPSETLKLLKLSFISGGSIPMFIVLQLAI